MEVHLLKGHTVRKGRCTFICEIVFMKFFTFVEFLNFIKFPILMKFPDLIKFLILMVDEEDGLKYQIEYLVSDGNSDAENLRSVLNRICAIRESFNIPFFRCSSKRMVGLLI